MEHVSVTKAKADFEQLFERARAGEEFVLTKWGKPVAKLVPYDELSAAANETNVA